MLYKFAALLIYVKEYCALYYQTIKIKKSEFKLA
jgi:hypothetical protein